jgi:hypothetical protein
METPQGNNILNPCNIQIEVTMNSTHLMALIFASTSLTMKTFGFH